MNDVNCLLLPHVHMGSVFSLDPLYSYISSFLNPSDASETSQWMRFPTGAHSVDPAAEYVDVATSPESESGEQQQQPTTTTC